MKIITFDDIKELNISPKQCYEWVCEQLANKQEAILPPKISMKPMDGVFCNTMPCVISHSDEKLWGGVKVVTRYPDRVPSLDSSLLLFDANNGKTLALMDANWITAMRTGAVAAHSIMLLAKSNFNTLGFLGLGNTARATLLVLAHIITDRRFNIKLLKYKGQEKLFAERFAQYENLDFSFVDTAEELVRNSDVVVSAVTCLTEDICSDDCFDKGVLVVPIHTRGFTNCDLFFDKVFADDEGHVCGFKYFNKFKKFGEVADVVANRIPGRENDEERILAYNIGISVHDINYASHIYKMLENDETIGKIDLQAPTDKFWI